MINTGSEFFGDIKRHRGMRRMPEQLRGLPASRVFGSRDVALSGLTINSSLDCWWCTLDHICSNAAAEYRSCEGLC